MTDNWEEKDDWGDDNEEDTSSPVPAPIRPIVAVPSPSFGQPYSDQSAQTDEEVADAEDDTSDISSVSAEDMEYLVGGTDDPFLTGEGATDNIGMSARDREFLLGVPEHRTRTKYTVSPKRPRRKTKAERERDRNEFLFGTKGVL